GVEPAVRAKKRELVMVSVRIRKEPRRLQRDPGDGIGFGDINRETDRVGARVWRRRAEAIDVMVAEGVGDGRAWMQHAEARVVEKHEPNVGRESALPAELAQDV